MRRDAPFFLSVECAINFFPVKCDFKAFFLLLYPIYSVNLDGKNSLEKSFIMSLEPINLE